MADTTRRRARWVGLAATMISVIALSMPGEAVALSGDGTTDGGSRCTPLERQKSLILEQRRVLAFLADIRVLRDDADIARLPVPRGGASYGFLSHAFTSIAGMGFSVVNVTRPRPGEPALLLYRANPDATDLTDPWGADFPYELVGWGYASPYAPGVLPDFSADPGLRCLGPKDWFVHERGVHPFDTWQNIPVAPQEAFKGQVAGGPPPTPEECGCAGVPHPRLWDIHFWIGASGVPTISMLNPGEPLPGFDPVIGVGFFYPHPWSLAGPLDKPAPEMVGHHHG